MIIALSIVGILLFVLMLIGGAIGYWGHLNNLKMRWRDGKIMVDCTARLETGERKC